ncbi:MAG: hypothetical protein ACLRIL_09590 [Fusicatenibacter saccharivorans]
MKERKLYSLTGKLIVFLLLIVFAASALFGGIQTLMLSQRRPDAECGSKKSMRLKKPPHAAHWCSGSFITS